MLRKKQNKQRGFGLVEVLVSITIISFVIVAFNQLAVYAYYNWEDARAKSVAYNLIQSTMEDLRNRRDVNVNNTNTVSATWSSLPFPSDNSTPILLTANTIDGKKYDTWITITPVDVNLTSPVTTLTTSKKKVVVEVSWTESVGTKTLRAETYLTDWKGKY